MTATSFKPKLPLPPTLVEPLLDLDDHLQVQGIPYLLTGGMAREILLHYGHDCPPGRATTDLDFGVILPDWNAYDRLRAVLTTTVRFKPDPLNAQRVFHVSAGTGQETRIDLVPFGTIASSDGQLEWPPDGQHVMSVLGYQEALDGAVWLQVTPERCVPMASPWGLALLKLVVWADRGEERLGRDVVDFVEILRRAQQILSDTELYDDYPAAMTAYGFEPEPAGAWVIGRQVAEHVGADLTVLVGKILLPEAREHLLDFASRGRSSFDRDEATSDDARLVDAFDAGFRSKATVEADGALDQVP